ncbi:MAG: tetratricopeptide repeat protein [Desulfosarcina sp.]|nr:tetratricopeptide repeat protein [Desulfobacterales bacterium]
MIRKSLKLILPLLLTFGMGGCAITEDVYVSAKNYARGEYYLENNKYGDCIAKFTTEIEKHPTDAKAHFYLGRCYLAVEKNGSALAHLKKAVVLDQGNPDYYFWQGVAYAANGKSKSERKSYEDALAIKPDHIQTLVYLGHNRFEAGRYLAALDLYNQALKRRPYIPQALYNRGLVLRKLNRSPEEINAWEAYLAAYPNGAFSRRAVLYLNGYGRFDYRNHTIGKRTLTLPQVRFATSSARIQKASFPSLKKLARITAKNSKLVLHIVAYQKNNRKLAEMRAKSVKKFLLDQEGGIDGVRIKVSWFDRPETVKNGRDIHHLDSSVNFFGQIR